MKKSISKGKENNEITFGETVTGNFTEFQKDIKIQTEKANRVTNITDKQNNNNKRAHIHTHRL